MIPYKVTIDKEIGAFIIQGDFNPDAAPVSIPLDDPDRQQFIDYFLHKADIDDAFSVLQCISPDNTETINRGLFIAGLNSGMKVFKKSAARSGVTRIDREAFLEQFPQAAEDLKFFESLRDKHYIHDENSMIQATAFLLLNPEGHPEKFGGPPSVVFNFQHLNYCAEAQHLQQFLCSVGNYIVRQIDKIGDQIADRYASIERKQLEDNGPPKIELASTQNIDKNRG